MEKVYTVSPMGQDVDLYEVCIYKNGEEVGYHIVSLESRLNELISSLEAEGYERELKEDQYEEEAREIGYGEDEEDFDDDDLS